MDKYKNNNNYAKTFSNGFIIKKFNISKQDNVNKTRNISPLSKTDRQCFSVHNNTRKKLKILTINSDKLILSMLIVSCVIDFVLIVVGEIIFLFPFDNKFFIS